MKGQNKKKGKRFIWKMNENEWNFKILDISKLQKKKCSFGEMKKLLIMCTHNVIENIITLKKKYERSGRRLEEKEIKMACSYMLS